MNRKAFKLVVTFAFAFVLSISPVLASNGYAISDTSNAILSYGDTKGISLNELGMNRKSFELGDISGYTDSASDVETFFDRVPRTTDWVSDKLSDGGAFSKSANYASLNNFSLTCYDSIIAFQADLKSAEINKNIGSKGNFYIDNISNDAAVADGTAYVEMGNTDAINFVQFRIDKNAAKRSGSDKNDISSRSMITIILQNSDTLALYQFQFLVDQDIFIALEKNYTTSKLNETDLKEKIANLMSVNRHMINGIKPEFTVPERQNAASSQDYKQTAMAASYNGWKSLLSQINRYGYAKLGNYSSTVDTSVFKRTAWSYYNTFNPIGYSFSALSMRNGSSEYMIHMTLSDVIYQGYWNGNPGSGGIYETALQFRINDGAIVRYDIATDYLYALFCESPLSYKNVELAINGLTNNAVYISRTVWKNYSAGGDIVRAAISLWSPTATLVSCFDYLSGFQNQGMNSSAVFDSTFQMQKLRYGGQVIRGIYDTSGNHGFHKLGEAILLSGKISVTNGSSTWNYAYKYNCFASI